MFGKTVVARIARNFEERNARSAMIGVKFDRTHNDGQYSEHRGNGYNDLADHLRSFAERSGAYAAHGYSVTGRYDMRVAVSLAELREYLTEARREFPEFEFLTTIDLEERRLPYLLEIAAPKSPAEPSYIGVDFPKNPLQCDENFEELSGHLGIFTEKTGIATGFIRTARNHDALVTIGGERYLKGAKLRFEDFRFTPETYPPLYM